MELTFLQLMQFRYLRRQQEAEDAFWKMRLKQFTMTAYTAPGILNEVEQPLATEDTTTIEQESFEPYPVINTLDTKPTHNMEQATLVQNEVPTHVQNVKQCRKDGDEVLQQFKALPPSREISLAITNLQQAIMWLGMELKRINEPNPYPESYNSQSTKIEPTTDGLKL